MSEAQEQAKAMARAEAAEHGDRLPLTRRKELRDRVCSTAVADERAALRAECALAGWRLCPHSGCQPDHCRR